MKKEERRKTMERTRTGKDRKDDKDATFLSGGEAMQSIRYAVLGFREFFWPRSPLTVVPSLQRFARYGEHGIFFYTSKK